MAKKDLKEHSSISSHDSDLFSLSEDSFFTNISELEDLRTTLPDKKTKEDKNIANLLDITEHLLTTFDRQKIFKIIMEKAIELIQAERGYLILVDNASKTNNLTVAYMQNMDSSNPNDALKQVSSTIINRVINEKRVEIVKNALKDEEYEIKMSIVNLQLKSIMCVPMIIQDEVIGIIYVEHRTQSNFFNKEGGELLSLFGNQCAIALQNAELMEEKFKYEIELEKKVENRTAELYKEKKYVENILQNIGELLFTTDKDLNVVRTNDAVSSILGWEADHFKGMNISKIYGEEDFVQIQKSIKDDEGHNILCKINNSKNEPISFSASISKIQIDNKTEGYVIINTDMTEVQKYEQERLSRKELESITKAAVTANDQINTPLGVIIGRATILSSMLPDNKIVQKNVEIIKSQSYRIKATLDKMKQITKVSDKAYKLDGITMLDLNQED